MSHYLVLGAGKMGVALAKDLIEKGERDAVLEYFDMSIICFATLTK